MNGPQHARRETSQAEEKRPEKKKPSGKDGRLPGICVKESVNPYSSCSAWAEASAKETTGASG